MHIQHNCIRFPILKMLSRQSSKESHNRLINSSTPGKYDGNPANLPDYLRTVQNDLDKEGITGVAPTRPYCMRNLPPGGYKPLEQARDQSEYNEIEKFMERMERYRTKERIHLTTVAKYLSPQVFEEIRPVHDSPTHPVDVKIVLIMHYLTQDATSKATVAVQLITKEITKLPFATSLSDAIVQLTLADTKYAQLADLGFPRPESDKKSDLHRIVSNHTCFEHFNYELEGTRMNHSYDDLKAFLKVLNLGRKSRTSHQADDSEPAIKKARTDVTSALSLSQPQINATQGFPVHSSPGASHQRADGSIWAMTSPPTGTHNPRNPGASRTPRVVDECWNCRQPSCPGRTNPKMCDKFYCRLCDLKNVLTVKGVKDCMWSNARDPRYHLPHQCAYCPARFKDTTGARSQAAGTNRPNPVNAHPTPYAHNKGPTTRPQPTGYSSMLSTFQVNMVDADTPSDPDEQAFQDLMTDAYSDSESI